MKLNKPKYWDSKNIFLSILFFPITILILFIILIKKKIARPVKFNIPIICMGNIYLGGTGKTPSSIFLAKELAALGKNPVILRKFYKSHVDEYSLIKNEFKNLILCHNRIDGIKQAEKEKFDTVILDDGLQDYKIKKKLNIACFTQNQQTGNGLIIPFGPLRESLNALKDVNIILINGKRDEDFEKQILNKNKNLKIFYSYFEPTNIDQFRDKKLLAIAGIGNPENFFKLVRENGLVIQEKLIFPDHYEFTENEIKNIVERANSKKLQIITTEKDYFKIKSFNIHEIKFLKVSLKINEKEKFIETINAIYD